VTSHARRLKEVKMFTNIHLRSSTTDKVNKGLPFLTLKTSEEVAMLTKLEKCIEDLRLWMK